MNVVMNQFACSGDWELTDWEGEGKSGQWNTNSHGDSSQKKKKCIFYPLTCTLLCKMKKRKKMNNTFLINQILSKKTSTNSSESHGARVHELSIWLALSALYHPSQAGRWNPEIRDLPQFCPPPINNQPWNNIRTVTGSFHVKTFV